MRDGRRAPRNYSYLMAQKCGLTEANHVRAEEAAILKVGKDHVVTAASAVRF